MQLARVKPTAFIIFGTIVGICLSGWKDKKELLKNIEWCEVLKKPFDNIITRYNIITKNYKL